MDDRKFDYKHQYWKKLGMKIHVRTPNIKSVFFNGKISLDFNINSPFL